MIIQCHRISGVVTRFTSSVRLCSTKLEAPEISKASNVTLFGKTFESDEWTNVNPKIIQLAERKLHLQKNHPLGLISRRITNFMYESYKNVRGNPVFSVYDNLNPIVTLYQNYDSLLVPLDHPSRKKTDSYYINKDLMLRAHTSAHQVELISMGLDNFLVIGDVYRRDSIDSSHYPVFHQVEGVRLFNAHDFFETITSTKDSISKDLKAFENGESNPAKQATHSLDAARLIEIDLKACLLNLTKELFGQDIEYRWVDCYFPFTHPSWELEIFFQGDWMEVLGCGIIQQKILNDAGANEKLGWAFGLGLERLAMKLYQIPDIRLFWSQDSGFLSQFLEKNPKDSITFKPFSKFPQCTNDLSFWLPQDREYSENDFYDIVREVGGDIVEQVSLVDSFTHPKKGTTSHCYRIVYRHMEKTLLQQEVNEIHSRISELARNQLNVIIR